MNTDLPFLASILELYAKAPTDQRFLIGIVGPPASGKSFMASKLPDILNEALGEVVTSSFAMDAYHHHNEQLKAQGIHPHKGCHFTFDVKAFTEKILEIKESLTEIQCPIYDRSRHNPTPNAAIIRRSDRIICIEGNYLLLNIYPWGTLKYLFDYTLFIEVDPKIQFQRLMQRHQAVGKSREEAHAKIHRTDLPNTALISQFKGRADLIFQPAVNLDP